MKFSLPPKQTTQQAPRPAHQTGSKPLITQLTQFLMAGGLATCLHWSVMGLLVWMGFQPVIATTAGALAGSFLNYLLQFYGPFKGNGTHGAAIPAYVLTVILGWCINAGLLHSLIHFAHIGLGLAQLCTTATVAAMNFTLYQRMVFHERTSRKLAS
ncbi:GtrA family protein [Pollutimonas harenae]|uniref:GtrA family protein n=1 Tax=Pollutimonas harenae TaxID=657015 RepID=A0A853GZI1_9BURK|nr:GtrA family protein [Pollutimonas harenae]NYT84819.1 GtrA family protein [Pollutimonas harenae]